VGYKILGYLVWNGGRWYVKRRYGSGSPARRVAALGIVGAAVAALAVAGVRRGSS
jgi:hypothetical protein